MTSSVRAAHPSYIALPQHITDKPTVFEFLSTHFTRISKATWRQRIIDGKVHWQDGSIITLDSAYRPMARVYYYREVAVEKKIPFAETILFQDNNIILAYKPHFLPVTPSGHFVNECLVHRLRLRTGIATLAPAHRLDRDTAGILLMTINPATRHLYHQLFANKTIHKHYQAIAPLTATLIEQYQSKKLTLPLKWTVKNRIQPANPDFTMQIVAGEPNSHSDISLIAIKGKLGLFQLSPITGKTHQLRLHMHSLGMPLLNDRFYPTLQPKAADDFSRPLQLLAQALSFTDPISNTQHNVQCQELVLP